MDGLEHKLESDDLCEEAGSVILMLGDDNGVFSVLDLELRLIHLLSEVPLDGVA